MFDTNEYTKKKEPIRPLVARIKGSLSALGLNTIRPALDITNNLCKSGWCKLYIFKKDADDEAISCLDNI